MSRLRWLGVTIALLTFAPCIPTASAQKLDATVLYRQDSDLNYYAVIPGYSHVPEQPYAGCELDPGSSSCIDAARARALDDVSLNVTGTTLSVLLPTGKVAVLNCINRYSARGTYINRRSCGMPLVEHVQAQMKGSSARLEWVVATGRLESENYRVLALLDKRTQLSASR